MKLLLSIIFTFISLLFLISPAYAQNLNQYFTPASLLGSTITLAGFLQPIISNIPVFTGIAAFFVALLAGFRFVASAGNAKETQNAANTLNYALIGLGLSVLAFWITRILFQVGGGGLF